uniref:Outer membrane protein TolC n=1 Tax=Candidatus Kentrum sp. UNK TaxID=2126344 RepID=A0A451AN50_9GAMM|nr:MAG: Outer membrane protein TolC [Candidatus Kentron sp. UNK]VFK72895.1 MAG: Outer membrane protein TolC [Candidatus Kentron sp. UNK]
MPILSAFFTGHVGSVTILLASLLALAACNAERYREDADKEVYAVIEAKQKEAGFEPAPLSIDPPERPLRERILARLAEFGAEEDVEKRLSAIMNDGGDKDTGEGGEDLARSRRGQIRGHGPLLHGQSYVVGAGHARDTHDSKNPDPDAPSAIPPTLKLTLPECLGIAAENSREYQTEKETVYLSALALTLERHAFGNRYTGSIEASAGQDSPGQRSGSVGADFGLERVLASGATIVLDIGAALFRVFTGGGSDTTGSLIDLTITQPLLRGAGKSIVQEPLTQAERNVLYAIRSFERAKRELAVDITRDLYRILQSRDKMENARANYKSLVTARERIEALANAGRTPMFQVDQAKQNELRARNGWITKRQSYESSLDRFKLKLGLPVEVEIEADAAELDALTEAGLVHVVPDGLEAQRLALRNRLDLANTRDQVADAERAIKVLEDALGASLSVSLSTSVGNTGNKALKFNIGDGTYLIGVNLGLPLDRKAERNAHRAGLIALDQAARALAEAEDNVKLDVREGLRDLAKIEESHRIQQAALALAERRVESTTLLQQAGRASTRDLLDAQEDLLAAQDAVTTALIDYAVARLELLRDMGLLSVDGEGLRYDAGGGLAGIAMGEGE